MAGRSAIEIVLGKQILKLSNKIVYSKSLYAICFIVVFAKAMVSDFSKVDISKGAKSSASIIRIFKKIYTLFFLYSL